MRGVTQGYANDSNVLIFLLTHLMRGVTGFSQLEEPIFKISTHTPHARCDVRIVSTDWWMDTFLLTHLMRGVTWDSLHIWGKTFLLTHLMRGVTLSISICIPPNCHFYSHTSCEVWQRIAERIPKSRISTHTPHARCDCFWVFACGNQKISTHTPHARCDLVNINYTPKLKKFLLTHLMRGVTHWIGKVGACMVISTHTPHARCDILLTLRSGFGLISTHTPHARCDMTVLKRWLSKLISTHTPHARCDLIMTKCFSHSIISTHTPHARCDGIGRTDRAERQNFYSHTSCEVWLYHSRDFERQFDKFLLTHLMRGVTVFTICTFYN